MVVELIPSTNDPSFFFFELHMMLFWNYMAFFCIWMSNSRSLFLPQENGYQLLFLSARAIVQAYLTRSFLLNLKQVPR